MFAAEERGFFRDEGLENETVVRGWSRRGDRGPREWRCGLQAVLEEAGSARPSKGHRSKRSCIKPRSPRGIWSFLPASLSLRTSRGKKIGVALIGDSEDRFTTLFVERAGLSAKDVTKFSVGTNPGDKILALKSGGIYAVVLDQATAWPNERGLRSLAYLGDIFPLPFQGYVTTDRKIAENSAQVKRWIRAMIKSLMFLRSGPRKPPKWH